MPFCWTMHRALDRLTAHSTSEKTVARFCQSTVHESLPLKAKILQLEPMLRQMWLEDLETRGCWESVSTVESQHSGVVVQMRMRQLTFLFGSSFLRFRNKRLVELAR